PAPPRSGESANLMPNRATREPPFVTGHIYDDRAPRIPQLCAAVPVAGNAVHPPRGARPRFARFRLAPPFVPKGVRSSNGAFLPPSLAKGDRGGWSLFQEQSQPGELNPSCGSTS